jgi:hypothetical protein
MFKFIQKVLVTNNIKQRAVLRTSAGQTFTLILHDLLIFFNIFHFFLSNNNFEPENINEKTITEDL